MMPAHDVLHDVASRTSCLAHDASCNKGNIYQIAGNICDVAHASRGLCLAVSNSFAADKTSGFSPYILWAVASHFDRGRAPGNQQTMRLPKRAGPTRQAPAQRLPKRSPIGNDGALKH